MLGAATASLRTMNRPRPKSISKRGVWPRLPFAGYANGGSAAARFYFCNAATRRAAPRHAAMKDRPRVILHGAIYIYADVSRISVRDDDN